MRDQQVVPRQGIGHGRQNVERGGHVAHDVPLDEPETISIKSAQTHV
jgi:hypothetical protein